MWILILTFTYSMQSARSIQVPGFANQTLCTQAGNAWLSRQEQWMRKTGLGSTSITIDNYLNAICVRAS